MLEEKMQITDKQKVIDNTQPAGLQKHQNKQQLILNNKHENNAINHQFKRELPKPVKSAVPQIQVLEDKEEETPELVEDTAHEWVDVKRKRNFRKSKKTIYGVAGPLSEQNNQIITAAPRHLWFHIGKLDLKTNKEMLLNYLEAKFSNEKFMVEMLPKRDEAKSISFKVGASFKLKEDMEKAENWPTGVAVRRFTFFRKSEGTHISSKQDSHQIGSYVAPKGK